MYFVGAADGSSHGDLYVLLPLRPGELPVVRQSITAVVSSLFLWPMSLHTSPSEELKKLFINYTHDCPVILLFFLNTFNHSKVICNGELIHRQV